MIRSHSIIGVVLLCLFVSSRAFVIQKLTNHVPSHCPRQDICLLVGKSKNLQRWPTITSLPSKKRQNEESSFDTSNATSPSFLRRWRKRVSKFSKTLLLASAFLSVAMGPKAAHAKFAHELQDERTMSLRPGVTQDQAIALNEGEVPDDLPEPSTSSTLQNLQHQRQQEQQQSETKKSSSSSSKRSFDYGDDDDGDDFDDFLDDDDKSRKSSPNTRTSISKSELSKASDFQSSTKSQFSGMGPKSTAQSRMLTLKVSIGLFIPTWGAMGVREFVRRRKEEKYVKKGLEILEAQKAEYFNITETTPDSDIEDELKDLKDEDEDEDEDEEDENDGDDDDDDDEEDEEDEDESPPRRTPKRPSGGPRDDSGGSSGGGDGRPSEDDLKRLGDIFNKS